jgi:glycosyltransferase involved in cell wall biosynthesis
MLAPDVRDRARLMIVGDDAGEQSHLAALVRELTLEDRVTLTGPRDDVARLMAACDVFVLSSDVEGLPLALLEACALRRACVATAVGGIPEVLENGHSGWLVPPGDASVLAGALTDAMRDPAARARVGTNAYRSVEERFSLERTAGEYARLYQRLLPGDPGSTQPDAGGSA